MQITSTSYIDFLLSTGLARVGKVRQIRRMYDGGYMQGGDYYRPVREGIVAMHRSGADPSTLDRIVDECQPARRDHYRACVSGHQEFMKNKRLVWTRKPTAGTWGHGDLQVVVNPELLLTIDGAPHRTKLYFKAEPLHQARADLLIELLKLGDGDGAAAIGILDVRRAKLFTQRRRSADYVMLLQSEALSFVAMWNTIGAQGQQQRPAIS